MHLRVIAADACAGAAALAGCAQAPAASAASAAPAGGEAACRDLPQHSPLAATHLSTRYVAAGTRRAGDKPDGIVLPAHCVLTGSIDPRTGVDGKPYATGFELSLPDQWNGRLLYIGGGGNDGVLRDTTLSTSISGATPSPLSQGWAVVSTDAGHRGQSADFALDPRARVDHAFDAHHKTALAARALIAERYGKPPHHAYFSGCSGGGRQGMMFSQRYPDLFDGITAGAPVTLVTRGSERERVWRSTRSRTSRSLGSCGPRRCVFDVLRPGPSEGATAKANGRVGAQGARARRRRGARAVPGWKERRRSSDHSSLRRPMRQVPGVNVLFGVTAMNLKASLVMRFNS
jgi:hypothetical protein